MKIRVSFMDTPPPTWADELRKLGINWTRSEAQPMADQMMLFDVSGDFSRLPKWAELIGATVTPPR